MPKKKPEDFEYISNNPDYVPDTEINHFMNEEIARAPQDPGMLAERMRQVTDATPQDAGGDVDANWEDVNSTGTEAVFGDHALPGQSDVEENAHAVGIDFQDNEDLEFIDKVERRDRNRFELDPRSKSEDDSI